MQAENMRRSTQQQRQQQRRQQQSSQNDESFDLAIVILKQMLIGFEN